MTTDEVFERAEQLALLAVNDDTLVPQYIQFLKHAQDLEGGPGWKGKRTMTQAEKILNHIHKNGSITQREAYLDYGVQSFHRRLSDLREAGFELVGERRVHPTTGQEYTRYFLG